MKYAILDINGQQFKVEEGKEVEIDFQKDKKAEDKVTFENVLLLVNDKDVMVGTPVIKGAKVTASVINHKKGKKVRVAKYKAKVRYRRVNGFRASLTTVKIESIASK